MASAFVAKPQGILRETGNMFAVALEGLRRVWDVKQWYKEFLSQMWFLAKVCSIPAVLISIPFGMVIALHVGSFTHQLGADSATGAALVLAIVREASPVACALLIAGAGGSAMTADIGSRKIRDEIAAMEVMAINPVHRLVTPRLVAAAMVSMLLVPMVAVAGLAGGFTLNVFVQGVTAGAYFSGFTALAQLADLWSALIKAFIFGLIAAMVSCYKGLYCKGGPKGVGDAVNQGVVVTFILIFFANFVLTTLYFAIVPQKF